MHILLFLLRRFSQSLASQYGKPFLLKGNFILFSDAIVAGVVDRWLQKTGSKYTDSIMGQEVGLNWS